MYHYGTFVIKKKKKEKKENRGQFLRRDAIKLMGRPGPGASGFGLNATSNGKIISYSLLNVLAECADL